MPFLAITAGAGLAQGVIGAFGAGKAAKTQAAAANRGLGFIGDDKSQALSIDNALTGAAEANNNAMYSPYTSAGSTAQARLSGLLQQPNQGFNFNTSQDPGYAFRLQQGTQAMEKQAAATGGFNSGGELKALTQYGQGFASNEYQNSFNRYQTQLQNLFQQTGVGLNATGQNAGLNTGLTTNELNNAMGTIGQNAALGAGLITGQGTAAASGTVGQANALGNAVGGTSNQLFLYNLLNQGKGTPLDGYGYAAPGSAGQG